MAYWIKLILAVGLLASRNPAQEMSPLAVDEVATLRVETLAVGQTKGYQWPLERDGRRYTVTVFTLRGDPDLFVSADPALPLDDWPWRSQAGPLQIERVSFIPPDQPPTGMAQARVQAQQDSVYLIQVTATPWRLQDAPAGAVCRLLAEPRYGDATTLIADLAVQNVTSTWYEVTLVEKAGGEGVARPTTPLDVPARFLLAPGQTRHYELAFAPNRRLKFRADRTTKAARIYLTCDVVARLLGSGRPLNPAVADRMEQLLPRLQPLDAVGVAFQRRDWIGGGRQLVATLRQHPDLPRALVEVLQTSGFTINPAALTKKIPLLIGGFRASELGLDTARAPESAEVTVQAVPVKEIRKLGN
jgi:hypothetical protein